MIAFDGCDAAGALGKGSKEIHSLGIRLVCPKEVQRQDS